MSYPMRLGLAAWLVTEFALAVLAIWGLGVLWAIVLFFGTSLIGGILLNVFGMKSLRAMQVATRAGKDPRTHMPSGMATVGSILLLLPGFATDVVGLLLIFPPTRFLFKPLALRLSQLMPQPPTMRPRRATTDDSDDVIDGTVVDQDPPAGDTDEPPQITDPNKNNPES